MSSIWKRAARLSKSSADTELVVFASNSSVLGAQLLTRLAVGRDKGTETVRAVPVEQFVVALQAHANEPRALDVLEFISENYPYQPGARLVVGLSADGLDAKLVSIAS